MLFSFYNGCTKRGYRWRDRTFAAKKTKKTRKHIRARVMRPYCLRSRARFRSPLFLLSSHVCIQSLKILSSFTFGKSPRVASMVIDRAAQGIQSVVAVADVVSCRESPKSERRSRGSRATNLPRVREAAGSIGNLGLIVIR